VPAEATRLAVDLSGASIRVLEGAMGGPMQTAAGSMPDGAWSHGKVLEAAAVGKSIRELLARNAMTSTRAWVAVSDELATFRTLSLDSDLTDEQVTAAVSKELTLDPERIATRWVDVPRQDGSRLVYAAAWDRAAVKDITEAIKLAGLNATVVELKSAAVARTVSESSCVVLDLVADPSEIVLIDENVPRLWHGFKLAGAGPQDLARLLGAPLLSVIRFHQRSRNVHFGPAAPVLVSTEQMVPPDVISELAGLVGQPVRVLPAPPRVPAHVRFATYLACLGLIMRRTA
jgi:hypothetical protein